MLTRWSRTSAVSAAASDASDSSFSAGRLANALLVGANTVHGPAESTIQDIVVYTIVLVLVTVF